MSELEMTYEDLAKEIEKAQKRAAKAVHLETKIELSQETYPLLTAIVEFFGERMDRTERVVNELINQTESLVQPELAEQILGTLNLGKQLATVVGKLRVGNLDAVTLARLKQFAGAFAAAAAATEVAVMEVTLEPPDEELGEEDGEEEGDAEGEEGDEAEEETDESAPVEVTLPDAPATEAVATTKEGA